MRLLEALALIPTERRPVLAAARLRDPVGGRAPRKAHELGLDADTRFLGWVGDDELEDLYAAASCFVFPSLYEGFGLPVLEAMARGVPVACSDRGSLPEVAGAAARLFDPEQPAAIAEAIETLLSDRAEADRLAPRAAREPREFTWQETARMTAEVYRRTLGASSA